MPDDSLPAITVIMPVRNEAAFIARSVGAILAQEYPSECVELLVVDGMSDDGTRGILAEVAAQDPRLRVLDNPARRIPHALNTGIRAARHAHIARMDGHTLAEPDYLRRCVEAMQASGAENVGGQWLYAADSQIAATIAAAMESKFAVGPGRWRNTPTPGPADTVPYGFWQRDTLLALGGFDEDVLINEDYELNHRLRAAGGTVYYEPAIRSTYYVRADLRKLARQYFRYGVWKARTVKMHPRSLKPRHLAAPLFVAGVVIGGLLSPFSRAARRWYGAALGTYAALSVFFSVRQARRHGWRHLPLLPVVFALLHVTWGAGFWAGVWKWWIRRDDERP